MKLLAGKDYRPDWTKLPAHLVTRLTYLPGLATPETLAFEEMRVYLSINPKSEKDVGLKRWATSFLDRLPGVFVNVVERRHKGPPKCPSCYADIAVCPHCGRTTEGTQEKGVDTLVVTDMIRLAWEASYEVAVLISEDRDFVPAVEFLQAKGVKVVQAGFGQRGHELAAKCWASLNLASDLGKLSR